MQASLVEDNCSRKIAKWKAKKKLTKTKSLKEGDGSTSKNYLKGAVSRNSAKLGNYKMPVKLRETKITA